jgi:hypothetical protein
VKVAHNRRDVLKKGIVGLVGGLLGLYAVPKLTSSQVPNVSAVGQKQLDLLLASKALMEKMGILRAMSINEYANDGEVGMDWTVWIPSEDSIDQATDDLARQVLQLVGQ